MMNVKLKEALDHVMSVILSGAPEESKLLHKRVAELIRHKGGPSNSKAPFGSVSGQPGWYWLDNQSGLMLKVNDEGRLYIRGHYSKGHEWTRKTSTQVPSKWLGIEAFRTIYGQFAMDGQKAIASVPMHILCVKVWGTSNLRELFQKLITEKLLCVHLDASGEVAEYDYTQNKGFVRAEHNIKGLRGFKFPTHEQAKCVREFDGGLYAFEDPSKLNERVVKIFNNTDGLFVGRWKSIVIISRPVCSDAKMQAELDNAFCTGTAYSAGMFRFVGVARLVTKSLGGKMTIASPFTFKEFGDDAVVANLSSWKGGLNMLLNHTGVMSVEEQIKFCEDEANADVDLTAMALRQLDDAGLIKHMRVVYRGRGVDITYVETEEDFYATNLYNLYGCQYKELEPEEQDSKEYELRSMSSSYYLHMKGVIEQAVAARDFSFSLPAQIASDIENKVIVKSKPLTSFSIRELTNFFWSYCVVKNGARYVVDTSLLNDLMSDLVMENSKKASKAHKAMQKLAVCGYGHLPRITKDQAITFINSAFSVDENVMGLDCVSPIAIPERGWTRMEVGLSKLTDEQFSAKWKLLMSGDSNWPGLGGEGFVIEIEDYDFFVPGFKFLKTSILPVNKNTFSDENPECMFGDTMQTIMKLMMALRRAADGKEIDWSFNAAQHLVRMNAVLFEDRLNRMSVKGTYLTIAPRFWDVSRDSYIHSVSSFAAKKGHMSYSKDPVLFDKAVTGVVNDHDFPEDIFGELSDTDVFAMKSAVFVNNVLLMSQENDSDGDLCCLRFNLQLPLYTGQWDCVTKRVDLYVSGEKKYEMQMKRWRSYDFDQLAFGIHANRTAKENIGLMSSGLFQHAMLLENAILKGSMNPFWAKMLWNLYGYIVQDEAMRMIKHSGGANMDSGRSAYYESTSILSLLKGAVDTMFRGLPTDDGEQVSGFMHKVADYWADYDATNSRHTGSLEAAIIAYVTATSEFCLDHYKKPDRYNVSGHHTGRLTGNSPAGIELAIAIARKKCTNNQYKLFNVLQRGYFRHVEKTRLMMSSAKHVSDVFASCDISKPQNAIDVVVGVRHLAKREVKIPAHKSMSLAFQIDTEARNGWFAQHLYIGKLNIQSNEQSVCVVRWMHMLSNAVDMDKQPSADERVIALVQQDLANGPVDINYPSLDNWGE